MFWSIAIFGTTGFLIVPLVWAIAIHLYGTSLVTPFIYSQVTDLEGAVRRELFSNTWNLPSALNKFGAQRFELQHDRLHNEVRMRHQI